MNVWVGLDIAAKSFDMVSRRREANTQARRFSQDPRGHAEAIERLKVLKPSLIVMEATGIYYLDLAVALIDAGLPVSVINPKSFRHFAELKLSASKTDGLDAALLAEYGQCMQPRCWTPPTEARLALRDVARQINRLIGNRTQAKNRLHALKAKRATLPLLIEDEQEGIDRLDERIERLKRAALTLIKADHELSRQLADVTAAKGVGEGSAIALLGELCVLPAHLKAPQVSRHAGLDVRLSQSGTSVNKPGRLSKAGNTYLRAALYMPAMSAIQHDPRAKAFYEALVARGKKRMQALCAVMRKYLTGIWACVQKDTPFDSALLFSDVQLEKS